MTRRLLLTYLTITVFGLAVLVIPLGQTFASREQDRLVFDIERDATVVASYAEDALEADTTPNLEPLLDDYAPDLGRVVVVNADGISVYDTTDPDGPPRDFSTRPEIVDALDGSRSDGVRHSETLGYDLMYVAVPVASGGTVHGAVRITYPTSTLDARITDTWLQLATLSAVVLITVTAVGWILARSVTKPVKELRDATTDLASGNLTRRAPTTGGAPELRQLAETFNHTAETLEELVAAQKRFVADASHQLRTPLTALRLRLENLEPDLPPQQRAELETAIAETDRLARIVEGLLALARTNNSDAELGTIDLAAVITDRQRLWAPQAASHYISLTTDTSTTVPVHAAPGAVEQILDNLIANAINASPPQSTIAITTEAAYDHQIVHVVDQGPGLAPGEQARAFDRFWRSPTNTGPGSGLGLAIVAELAAASGGTAGLATGPDGGLDATIRLRTSPHPGPPTSPHGPERVLEVS